jgi:hypothetical protein
MRTTKLDLFHHFAPDLEVQAKINEALTLLRGLNQKADTIMTKLDDINAKLDTSLENQAAMQTSLTNIAADEAALKQQIADLIAQGSGEISAADAQALLDKATELADASAAAASQAAAVDTSTP